MTEIPESAEVYLERLFALYLESDNSHHRTAIRDYARRELDIDHDTFMAKVQRTSGLTNDAG